MRENCAWVLILCAHHGPLVGQPGRGSQYDIIMFVPRLFSSIYGGIGYLVTLSLHIRIQRLPACDISVFKKVNLTQVIFFRIAPKTKNMDVSRTETLAGIHRDLY